MSALSDFALAVHRIIWFPVHYALGLEQPGMLMPVDFGPGPGQRRSKRGGAAQAR
jgi:hypothetical protein